MKKTITLMSLLISTFTFAQFPTISATNQIPSIGDTISYVDANTFGFDPDGSGGAVDVIWNYSGLINNGSIDFYYVDPLTTPETDSFPNSNIALANSNAAGYEYFETTANSINRWGYTGGSSLYYDNSFARYTFPITPGVIQSQTYTGWMSPLGQGEDSVTVENGNYQANPDAYGTLSLPPLVFGGQPEVFDSVVRVHVTETFAIKVWLFGTPAVVVNVTDDYYFYFDNETQEPIVIYGVTTDDQGSAPITVLRYQPVPGTSTNSGTSSLNELTDASFKVYPNPSSSEVNVSFKESTERNIRLISLDGKVIETINTSETTVQFSVSDLLTGTYFIEVNANGKKSMKRVAVK